MLKKLGRKMPTRDQLDAARVAGELSAPVPTVSPISYEESVSDPQEDTDMFAHMTEAEIETAAIALAARLPDYAALDTHADFAEAVKKEFFKMFPPTGGSNHARI